MTEIDTQAILREIYGEQLSIHHDLYEKSNKHREEHGEKNCSVYPSTPAQAPVWPLLTAMVKAKQFLEVGCGLGYTAALMAEAGGPESHVDTIENTPLHADLAEEEFSRRGLANRIRILRGESRDILPTLTDPYDIIFVDADWGEYPTWLPHLTRLTRRSGVLVTANLFPLFEEWAQHFSNIEVNDYLIKLVHTPQFKTYIIPGKWHALSYRI